MDRGELFQIGEVAAMFHLSVSLLRHYEKIGLLTPEYVSPDTGYRYYSVRQFESLNTIRYLRLLGTPLEQIADFLNNRDLGRIQNLLESQRREVERRRRELELVERRLDRRLAGLRDALSAPIDVITSVQLPRQRMAWVRRPVEPKSYLDLETVLRDLDQAEPVLFPGRVGVGIDRECLLAGVYTHYDLIFLLLDPEDSYDGPVEELPPVPGVALRFRGSHTEAPAQYERLAQYMAEHGLEPAGFSREVALIDNGLTGDSDKFVTEIQIPVQPVEGRGEG